MADKSKIARSKRKAKYKTRQINRCMVCGRPRGFIRFFRLCRLCFRERAVKGLLPGVKKASW